MGNDQYLLSRQKPSETLTIRLIELKAEWWKIKTVLFLAMDSKHTHHCDDNKGTVKLQCYKLDFGVPDMIIFGYMTKYYHYLDEKKGVWSY